MKPHGRYSKEYEQFLCDRFYRRYKETAFIKIECIVEGCKVTRDIRANVLDHVFDRIRNTFKCNECKKSDYTSDDE
jgi:hypothetical protein